MVYNVVMRNVFVILYVLIIVFLSSCGDDHKVQPIGIEDGLYPIDRHGLVKDYTPDFSQNKIYVYLITDCINEWLERTPRGKIDKIVSENPEWELFVYVNGVVEDSARVRRKLNQYDCDFPVILDTKGLYRKRNKMKEIVLYGVICDKKDVVRGFGVIGDGLSIFDPQFEIAKRRIYGHTR